MRKIWILLIFILNDRCGLNTCNSSYPVKLSNFLSLIAWASRSTLDSLIVHFKKQKKTCIVHGSMRFFKDIIRWAGGFNTDKQRFFENYIIWHIMQLIKAKCHETKTQYPRRKWIFRVLKNAYTQQNFLRTDIVAWIKELFSLKVDFHGRFH